MLNRYGRTLCIPTIHATCPFEHRLLNRVVRASPIMLENGHAQWATETGASLPRRNRLIHLGLSHTTVSFHPPSDKVPLAFGHGKLRQPAPSFLPSSHRDRGSTGAALTDRGARSCYSRHRGCRVARRSRDAGRFPGVINHRE